MSSCTPSATTVASWPTSRGSPVTPTTPTSRPSTTSGSLTPGRSDEPASGTVTVTARASAITRVAPWCRVPIRSGSDEAMMTPWESITLT
nr:hypothetical protein [Serinibacter arcticus]